MAGLLIMKGNGIVARHITEKRIASSNRACFELSKHPMPCLPNAGIISTIERMKAMLRTFSCVTDVSLLLMLRHFITTPATPSSSPQAAGVCNAV